MLNKMSIAAVGIFISVFLLTGCDPVVGTVVDKEFEKGEMEHKKRQECKTKKVNGQTKTECKDVKYDQWDDADFILIVEDKGGDNHEVEVSEKIYNKYDKGAHFDEENQ